MCYAANVPEDDLANDAADNVHVQVLWRSQRLADSPLPGLRVRPQCLTRSHVRWSQALRQKAKEEGCEVIIISAQVEAELSELDEEEAKEYLQSLGCEEGGLSSLVRPWSDAGQTLHWAQAISPLLCPAHLLHRRRC